MKFIEMDKRVIKKLFYMLKKKLNSSSLDNVYKYLGISRPTLFNYLSKRYLIPEPTFQKICRKCNINPENIKYRVVRKEKFIKHDIKNPIISEDLAEILGALNGDGHISEDLYDISITGHKYLDSVYLDYLATKIRRIFNLKFTKSLNDNFSRIRGHSKSLGLILVKEFGLPSGKKKGKLKIPQQFLEDETLFFAYIRGLFDTDGTFYLRRKTDPVVEISSIDKNFLSQIKVSLCRFGFKTGCGERRIFIYNKKEIAKFFNLIRPANTKHLNKYQKYLNLN